MGYASCTQPPRKRTMLSCLGRVRVRVRLRLRVGDRAGAKAGATARVRARG